MWKQVLCGISWVKQDITLAVWIRVFVYYMPWANRTHVSKRGWVCELVWKCTRVCVRQGKSACSKQLQPSVLSNAYVRAVFNRNTEFHSQDFLFHFLNLLLNSLQPHWFCRSKNDIVGLYSLSLSLCYSNALWSLICGWSFSGFTDCCAEYLVRMFVNLYNCWRWNTSHQCYVLTPQSKVQAKNVWVVWELPRER